MPSAGRKAVWKPLLPALDIRKNRLKIRPILLRNDGTAACAAVAAPHAAFDIRSRPKVHLASQTPPPPLGQARADWLGQLPSYAVCCLLEEHVSTPERPSSVRDFHYASSSPLHWLCYHYLI